MARTSPVATSADLVFLDQRVVRPELAPYERGEVEQAVTLLNTILRQKINLSAGMSRQQALCCVTVIETLREVRRTAVVFGARKAADLARESPTLSQARRKILEYAYGKDAEDHE